MKRIFFIALILSLTAQADNTQQIPSTAIRMDTEGAPLFPDSKQYLNPQPLDEIRKTADQEQFEKKQAANAQKLRAQKTARNQIAPLIQHFLQAMAQSDRDGIAYENAPLFIIHIQTFSSVNKALTNLIRALLMGSHTHIAYFDTAQLSYPDVDQLITTLTSSTLTLTKTTAFRTALNPVISMIQEASAKQPNKVLDANQLITLLTKNGSFENLIQLLYTTHRTAIQKIKPDAEGFINMYNNMINTIELVFDIHIKNKITTPSEKGDYTHF